VWCVAGDDSPQFEELRARVLISRDRGAEGDHPQVLQPVVQFEETSVAQGPGAVPGCEGLNVKRGKPQEVVAAPLNQIDGQIVAGVDAEVGPNGIAHRQSLPFQIPAERAVFGANELRHLQQRPEGVEIPDSAKGHEHGAEFKTEKPRHGLSHSPEESDGLGPIPMLGGGAGEEDGSSAGRVDGRGLSGVQRGWISSDAFNVGSRHKASTVGQSAGFGEELGPLGRGQQVGIAGVHVDGRRQSGGPGLLHQRGPRIPVGTSIGMEDGSPGTEGRNGVHGGRL